MNKLASPDRLAEDVFVVPIVVTELELGDIERKIFGGYLMEGADDTTFKYRPEAFNRVGMDRPDDVLALAVVNDAVREVFIKPAITAPLIGAKQADFLRYCATHELAQGLTANVVDDPRDDLSLALDGPDDGRLTGTNAASSSAFAALVDMPVLGETADESLINLNDAHELAEVFVSETSAHAMAHIPSGAIGAEAHEPVNLKRADPFLAGEHQVDDAEPLAQGLIRVLKDRAGDVREAVVGAGRRASVAEPVPSHCPVRFDFGIAAARASDEFRPAVLSEIEAARVFVRESLFPLPDRHLVDLRFLLCAGHLGSPLRQIGECHASRH